MINLNNFVDYKQLQEIQDLFSEATGLAAIAVDAKGNYITNGSNFTDFCIKYTRGSEEGLRRCIKCDNECTGTYFCHAGLMDFSSDLIINDERVGAIIGGQVLPEKPDEEKFRQIASELKIDGDKYIEALRKVPIRDEKTIRAAAVMLANVINQLINLKYLEAINHKKVEVFNVEMQNVIQSIKTINSRTKDLQRVASMERILAINASVEAARAGQAGVGFAVVANEIGELSSNATSVYTEIQEIAASMGKSMHQMSSIELD